MPEAMNNHCNAPWKKNRRVLNASIKTYDQMPVRENHDPMVDLSAYDFILSPEYYHMGFSKTRKMHLRKGFADLLAEIQNRYLLPAGFKFKIWDAWRPRSVQKAIYDDYYMRLLEENPGWDHARLDQAVLQFVAKPDNPDIMPHHSTGGAVDLTLCHAHSGEDLDMGTGFDHFGPESAPDYFEHNDENHSARDNRRILFDAMQRGGDFATHPREWWHYDYGDQRWALLTQKPEAYYSEIKSL